MPYRIKGRNTAINLNRKVFGSSKLLNSFLLSSSLLSLPYLGNLLEALDFVVYLLECPVLVARIDRYRWWFFL